MALSVGELVGYLKLDKSQWDRGMSTAGGDVKKTSSAFSGLVKGAALLGGAFAAVGAVSFFKDAFAEAEEARKVTALTTAAIESTGGAAKISADQIGMLSERLSTMAGVDDEVIQSGANVLLTFTKIRNEVGAGNDVFDQATLATLNFSQAMGKDMSSSAVMVGKALNDPIAGLTALGKAGVQFTADQKAAIKAMVASGDTLGAQKIILGELETQFGGAAEAMATPADKARVAWANFKEMLGTTAQPLVDKVLPLISGGLKWVGDKIQGIIAWFEKAGKGGAAGLGWWRPAFDAVKAAVMSFWDAAGVVFDKLKEFWTKWGPVLVAWLQKNIPKAAAALGVAFAKIGTAIGNVIDFVSKVIGYFHDHEAAADALKAVLAGLLGGFIAFKVVSEIIRGIAAAQAILNAVMAMNPIGLVVIAIAALAAGLVYAWRNSETFRNIVIGVWDAVSGFVRGAWENVIKPVIDALVGAFHWVVDNAIALGKGVADVWTMIVTTLQTAIANVVGFFTGLITWVGELPGKLAAIAAAIWNWVWEKASVIKDNVVTGFVAFFTWVTGLPGVLAEKAAAIWTWIWTKASTIRQNVIDHLSAFWTWISELPGKLSDLAGDVFGWLIDKAVAAAKGAWQAIIDQFSGGGPGWGGIEPGDGFGGAQGRIAAPQGIGDQRRAGGFGAEQAGTPRGGDGASATAVYDLRSYHYNPVRQPSSDDPVTRLARISRLGLAGDASPQVLVLTRDGAGDLAP